MACQTRRPLVRPFMRPAAHVENRSAEQKMPALTAFRLEGVFQGSDSTQRKVCAEEDAWSDVNPHVQVILRDYETHIMLHADRRDCPDAAPHDNIVARSKRFSSTKKLNDHRPLGSASPNQCEMSTGLTSDCLMGLLMTGGC